MGISLLGLPLSEIMVIQLKRVVWSVPHVPLGELAMNLSIPAWRNGHYVCLAELLLILGKFITNMQW